jgi:hypothetical protein
MRGRNDQVANRHDTDELTVAADDVEIEETFQFAALANLIDGALGRGIGGQCHEVGGHEPAHRTLGIADQFPHRGLTLRIKQAQDPVAAIVRQAIDKSDRVVGVGADDQTADLFVIEHGENVGKQLRRQLFECFRGAPGGKEYVEELSDFRRLESLEQRRDIGGMAFTDKSQHAVRCRGAQHLADGVIFDGRRFHVSALQKSWFSHNDRPGDLQMSGSS